jgi:hypothetical protein
VTGDQTLPPHSPIVTHSPLVLLFFRVLSPLFFICSTLTLSSAHSGYLGPGGISEHGKYEGCTGGIHRYVDIQLFTNKLIYHHPTCLELYGCQYVLHFLFASLPPPPSSLTLLLRPYDPEGFLGVLSACNLTYLGLMAGHFLLLVTSSSLSRSVSLRTMLCSLHNS